MSVRGAAKSAIGAAARGSGLLRTLQSALAARGAFPILGYHRVAADPVGMADDIAIGLAVTSEEFQAHAAHLAEAWTVVPLSEARRLAAAGELPPGACAITFDDGWADTCEVAFPILRRFGMTATVFLVADCIEAGGTLPSTRLYRALLEQARRKLEHPAAARARYRQIRRAGSQTIAASLTALGAGAGEHPGDRMLSEAQVRELAAAGWEIGCHGRSHLSLTGLKPSALLRETAEAKAAVESAAGASVGGFCYPLGDWDEAAAAAVRDAGFDYACASDPGWARPSGHPYAVPRIVLGPGTAGRTGVGLSVAMTCAAFSRPPQAAARPRR